MSIGGSGQTSESKSKAIDLTPKQYTKQRGFVAEQLRNRASGNVAGIEGPFVAGLSDQELNALGSFEANAFGPGGVGAAADQQLMDTLAGKENPFAAQAIDAAINPILRNAKLQELRDRAMFTGAGQKIQSSSAFTEDRTNAISETERNVGDVASQIAFQTYQQERQNQMQALQLANLRFAEQRQGIATLALPRLIEQLGIDKGNEELQRRFAVMEDALKNLAGLTTPTIGYNSSSQSSGGGANVGIGTTGGGGSGG
jgi:hypothetical protein